MRDCFTRSDLQALSEEYQPAREANTSLMTASPSGTSHNRSYFSLQSHLNTDLHERQMPSSEIGAWVRPGA